MPSFVADLLPVLALFAVGAAAGRRGLIGDAAVDGMKKIVASVALPALLFSAFAATKIEAAHLVLIAAIFAIAAGIIAAALFGQRPGLPWAQGGFLAKTLATVGGLTIPLICVSVGYGLRKGISGGRDVLKAVLARMAVAIPIGFLIAYGLLPLLGIPAGYSRAVVVLFLLPPPYVIAIFRQGREETDYASAVITLHTALSMVAIVVFALATSGSGSIAAGGIASGAGV